MSDFRQRISGSRRTCLIALVGIAAILAAFVTTHPVFSYPDFIQDAVEPAQMSQRETGVPASVTIAQAITESSWGDKHIGEAYNYFGIKAFEMADGTIYVGPVAEGWVLANTTETINGKEEQIQARFRDYANMADSFTDHGYFLWENELYHPAFQYETEPREFARLIAAAGYATDPEYGDTLLSILEKYDLFQYDVPGEPPPGEDVPGIVVDDKDAGFEHGGTPKYWYELGVGYKRHSCWTNVTPSNEDDWARWTPLLSEPGIYEVSVYVPPLKATTKHAHYLVQHAGTENPVELSQIDHLKEWVSLGQYAFAAQGDEYIRLSDLTGEPIKSATIAFDAVRLVRVGEAPPQFDAALAGSPDIVIAYVGQTAEIRIEVRNTGLQTWRTDQVVLTSVKQPLNANETQALPAQTLPSSTVTWNIDIHAPDKPGVFKSEWRLKQADETFGPTLSAYLVVLPEGNSELEEKIRRKIEEWRQAGEQKIEELIKEIIKLIEREVQSFIEKLIEDLLRRLCGASALVLLGVLLFWWQRR